MLYVVFSKEEENFWDARYSSNFTLSLSVFICLRIVLSLSHSLCFTTQNTKIEDDFDEENKDTESWRERQIERIRNSNGSFLFNREQVKFYEQNASSSSSSSSFTSSFKFISFITRIYRSCNLKELKKKKEKTKKLKKPLFFLRFVSLSLKKQL